ncbi:MAG: inorganic phosphate transporter [Gammaproteobacteria bacterium]
MAWGVGANDVANAMGTSVGSRALTIKQAVIVAAIFESAGALLAGGQVTDTIRSQIIDIHALSATPEILVYGMLASLLAAGLWLLLATHAGWPVSTTHSIVGAIIGFGLVNLGVDAIYWHKVINIVLSWIVTPLLSGLIAFGIFRSVQTLILSSNDPLNQAKRYVPIYIFFAAFIITMVTLTKGLKHLGLHFTYWQCVMIAFAISVAITLLSYWALRRIKTKLSDDPKYDFKNVERTFGVLMIFTASAMAFAHGSNDVANAIGPIAAVVSILNNGGAIITQSAIPNWVLVLGAVGIVTGLATYGYKVIATIGDRITELTPTRGFAAELATATTIIIASGTGLPVSTTQTLVGAVLGVGFARGIGALNLAVIRNIFLSWLITLPAGAILSIVFFYIFNTVF